MKDTVRRELRKPSYKLPSGKIYEIPEAELVTVHVQLEKERYLKTKKISTPNIMKYNVVAWNAVIPFLETQGFDSVKVLHAPKGAKPYQTNAQRAAK